MKLVQVVQVFFTLASTISFASAQECENLSVRECRNTEGCVKIGRSCSPAPPPPPPPASCPDNTIFGTLPGFGVTDQSAFNLWLDFELTEQSILDIYTTAYNRWTSIINSDSNLGGSGDTSTMRNAIQCSTGLPSTLDDLYICGRDICLDGEGAVLGRAGFQYLWTDTNLPATGFMEFDSADIPRFLEAGLWEAIILHEMGHVLGIGTAARWNDLTSRRRKRGRIFADFTGPNAVDVWKEDWGCTGLPPIETDGGGGTAFGHWDDDCFQSELMTGFVSSTNFLSSITLAALEDIGYTSIDRDQADPYTPPASCCDGRRRQLRSGDNGAVRNLQGNSAEGLARRPPLSAVGLAKAEAYGKAYLVDAKLPEDAPRVAGGFEYVGDQFITIYYEENGFVYDVDVTAI